jgi:hypothetical protein
VAGTFNIVWVAVALPYVGFWHEAAVTRERRGIRFQAESRHDADWLKAV